MAMTLVDLVKGLEGLLVSVVALHSRLLASTTFPIYPGPDLGICRPARALR